MLGGESPRKILARKIRSDKTLGKGRHGMMRFQAQKTSCMETF